MGLLYRRGRRYPQRTALLCDRGPVCPSVGACPDEVHALFLLVCQYSEALCRRDRFFGLMFRHGQNKQESHPGRGSRLQPLLLGNPECGEASVFFESNDLVPASGSGNRKDHQRRTAVSFHCNGGCFCGKQFLFLLYDRPSGRRLCGGSFDSALWKRLQKDAFQAALYGRNGSSGGMHIRRDPAAGHVHVPE